MNTGLSACALCWPRLCTCPKAITKAMDQFVIRGFYLHSVLMTNPSGKAVSIDEAGVRKYVKREPRWWRMRGRT